MSIPYFFTQLEELTSDEEFVEEEEEHQPQYDSDGDEIPDVDDINIDNKDNRANCINSDIDKVTNSLQHDFLFLKPLKIILNWMFFRCWRFMMRRPVWR